MKVSTSMWSLDRKIKSDGFSQTDFINWAAENNLKYVELLSYYMNKEKNPDEIISFLKAKNIEVSCYTILSDFTVIEEIRETALLKDLDMAQRLSAPFVRILAGDANPDTPDAMKKIISGINQAAEKASERNLVLILENIGPYSCHSSQIGKIMRETGKTSVRVNFDTANPLLADENPIDSLKALLPYISYIHYKDFVTDSEGSFESISSLDKSRIQYSEAGKGMTGITAGKGNIPLKEQIKILKEDGYDGFVSIEYEGTGDSIKDTEASLKHLRTLL